jgi:hypothetical protein
MHRLRCSTITPVTQCLALRQAELQSKQEAHCTPWVAAGSGTQHKEVIVRAHSQSPKQDVHLTGSSVDVCHRNKQGIFKRWAQETPKQDRMSAPCSSDHSQPWQHNQAGYDRLPPETTRLKRTKTTHENEWTVVGAEKGPKQAASSKVSAQSRCKQGCKLMQAS